MLLRAELSNECWQADTTHWSLSDGTDVEVLNIIDDHSRLLVASRASLTTKAADVVATFEAAATEVGLPASLLTDNVAIFTAESRGGRCAIETLLLALGVTYKHGQPYHPRPITEPGCDDVGDCARRWFPPRSQSRTDLVTERGAGTGGLAGRRSNSSIARSPAVTFTARLLS